jgi:hypothetical protein
MQPLLARWRLPRRLRSAISRPLVLGDHALKLDQQTLFGAVAAPAEFFDQQHLIGVVTAQPIGRIDQDGFKEALDR